MGRAVHVQHRHQQPLRLQSQLCQRVARLLQQLHGDRQVFRGQGAPQHRGVLPAGHLEGQSPRDGRLRRALPVVYALVLDPAGRRLRARAV